MNMPLSHSPPNKYANCAKTLPIQVAAIFKTPINTRSPHVRLIAPSGSQVQGLGLDGGTPENPIFIGILGVAGKRWVKRKMWKKAEKVQDIMPKVYPHRRGWVKFLPITENNNKKNDRK